MPLTFLWTICQPRHLNALFTTTLKDALVRGAEEVDVRRGATRDQARGLEGAVAGLEEQQRQWAEKRRVAEQELHVRSVAVVFEK